MSWGDFFNNVEIEGEGAQSKQTAAERLRNSDPFSWFPGRGKDAVVGAGRMEIAHDSFSGCCAGEEISDIDYRAKVVRQAALVARSHGRKSPNSADIAEAQRSVDTDLEKRDVSRSYRW